MSRVKKRVTTQPGQVLLKESLKPFTLLLFVQLVKRIPQTR
jgi:hypothetical protein